MSVLFVQPSTMMRDWNDVIKAPGRFEGFDYGFDEDEYFDLTHRVEYAVSAAAAGGGAMLDPLHRYIMVKNMGTVPVLLHFNLQANAPNPAFEVSILPGCFVEYADLWMTVQPSIRVDSAVSSASVECEVLQIGDFTPIEEEPQEFCDLWAVGHIPQAGCLTKHNPELPGPWEVVANPLDAEANHWLADVAGIAEDDYWAVGYTTNVGVPVDGILFDWTGAAWVEDPEESAPPFYGVWGFASDDYWAVGGDPGGPAEIWNGPAWAQDCVPEQGERVLYCVHGDLPANIYAGGELDLKVSYNGVAWVVHPPTPEHETDNWYGTWTSALQVSYMCGGDKAWWDDSGGDGAIITEGPPGSMNWQEFALPFGCPTLRAMWGFNDNDIWAVGDNGWILHYTGPFVGWVQIPEPAELEGNYDYRGVFGCWPWGVWAIGTNYAGTNVIIFWDGLTWTVQDGPDAGEGDLLGLKGVWVAAP